MKENSTDSFSEKTAAKKKFSFSVLCLLLFFLSAPYSALSSQPGGQRKIIVFINDFETKGVDQSLGARITSVLMMKFTGRFQNSNIYTRQTISFMKKEVEKQLKNSKNCNAEKCQREISNALDADYSVSGEISLNSSNQKLNIAVMVLSRNEDEELEVHNFSLESYEEQLEYFGGEIVSKAVNSGYVINVKNAPTIEKTSVQIKKIEIKDVPGVLIEVPEYKSSKYAEFTEIINDVNKDLRRGDLACKKKDYDECDKIHTSNYVTIAASFSGEKLKKLSEAVQKLEERIHNAKNNKYNNLINKITVRYEKADPENEKIQRKFLREFSDLAALYKKETEQYPFSFSEDIYRALYERQAAATLSVQKIVYKRAEREFQSLNFENAYVYFLHIKHDLDKLDTAYDTPEVTSFKKFINDQIETTKKSGTSYMDNQIMTGLGQASSSYFVATRNKLMRKNWFYIGSFLRKMKKNKNRKALVEKAKLLQYKGWKAKAKEGQGIMGGLKDLMRKNPRFVSPDALKRYNDFAQTVQKNKNLSMLYNPGQVSSLDEELKEKDKKIERSIKLVDESVKVKSISKDKSLDLAEGHSRKKKKLRFTPIGKAEIYNAVFCPGCKSIGSFYTGFLFNFALYGYMYGGFHASSSATKYKNLSGSSEKYLALYYIDDLMHNPPIVFNPMSEPGFKMMYLYTYFTNFQTKRAAYKRSVATFNGISHALLAAWAIGIVGDIFASMFHFDDYDREQGLRVSKEGGGGLYVNAGIVPDIPFTPDQKFPAGQKLELQMNYRF